MTVHRHGSPSTRFLKTVQKYRRLLFITHDNPDPDAIATGWALCELTEARLNCSARIVGGGTITRAENRHLLRLLHPPLVLSDDLRIPDDAAAILIDCGPDGVNHLLADKPVTPVAVIDHHSFGTPAAAGPDTFVDIRPELCACATIAATYCKEQKFKVSEKVATAMVYAIQTETKGRETSYTELDQDMIRWLSTLANPTWIAEIENAPLTRAYYSDLTLALQCTFVYDHTALCILPDAEGAETVGEVADLLIRCEGIHQVLCAAALQNRALVSVRTSESQFSAAELIRQVLKGLGHSGGHRFRAGGCIPHLRGSKISDELETEIRKRWLAACHVNRERGTRLVPRRRILDAL